METFLIIIENVNFMTYQILFETDRMTMSSILYSQFYLYNI